MLVELKAQVLEFQAHDVVGTRVLHIFGCLDVGRQFINDDLQSIRKIIANQLKIGSIFVNNSFKRTDNVLSEMSCVPMRWRLIWAIIKLSIESLLSSGCCGWNDRLERDVVLRQHLQRANKSVCVATLLSAVANHDDDGDDGCFSLIICQRKSDF